MAQQGFGDTGAHTFFVHPSRHLGSPLLDLFYHSALIPKLLGNFIWEQDVISCSGCMTQPFFFCIFAIAKCYMLVAMAYDSYAAICNPLFYNVTMSPKVECGLVVGIYIMTIFGGWPTLHP
jgi:olfactory receptor